MTLHVVGPGDDFPNLQAALNAFNVTIMGGDQVGLRAIGTEPAAATGYLLSNRTPTSPITIRPLRPEENGGVPVDLAINVKGTLSNVNNIHWVCDSRSRLRVRNLWRMQRCSNWKHEGDLDYGAEFGLDGDSIPGNLVFQYGWVFEYLSDDIELSGFMACMRKNTGGTLGYRGWNAVPAMKWTTHTGGGARLGTNFWMHHGVIRDYANDGFQYAGDDCRIEDMEIFNLYPRGSVANDEHIDGIHQLYGTGSRHRRIKIHHILYQASWTKVQAGGIPGHDFVDDFLTENIEAHTIGGQYLTDPDMPASYRDVGGTGYGVVNVRTASLRHAVMDRLVGGPGIQNKFEPTAQPSHTMAAQHLSVENCVTNFLAVRLTEGGTSMPYSLNGPGWGQLKGNLQTQNKTSSSVYQVIPAQAGDLVSGTAPGYLPNSYVPSNTSALKGAGTTTPDASGHPYPPADIDGITWPTPRSIGAHVPSGTSPVGATANAGPDAVVNLVSGQGVALLDGTRSSSQGTASFLWTQLSGPTAVLATPTLAQCEATITGVGVAVFNLRVGDSIIPGVFSNDTVAVTVELADYSYELRVAVDDDGIIRVARNADGDIMVARPPTGEPEVPPGPLEGVTYSPVDGGGPAYWGAWEHGWPTADTFFPLTVFNEVLEHDGDAEQYAALGINTFFNLYNGVGSVRLARVVGAGMYLIVGDGPDPAEEQNSDAIVGRLAGSDEPDGIYRCNAVRDELAAVCTGVPGSHTHATAVRDMTNVMKSIDPTRFVCNQLTKPFAIEGYCCQWTNEAERAQVAQAADMISYDYYPVSDPYGGQGAAQEVWAIWDTVTYVRELATNLTPVMPFIELSRVFPDSDRSPTLDEMEAEVWQAVAAGARGINYFNHNFYTTVIPGDPAAQGSTAALLRDSRYGAVQGRIAQVNADILELAPVLNAEFAHGFVVSATGNIRYTVHRHLGLYYIFAVPHQLAAQTVTITCAGNLTGVTVWGEARGLIVNGDDISFTDTFANGSAHHLYVCEVT